MRKYIPRRSDPNPLQLWNPTTEGLRIVEHQKVTQKGFVIDCLTANKARVNEVFKDKKEEDITTVTQSFLIINLGNTTLRRLR